MKQENGRLKTHLSYPWNKKAAAELLRSATAPSLEQILTYRGRFTNCPYETVQNVSPFFIYV